MGALSDKGKRLLDTSVVGYTTRKSFEAGAFAVRVAVVSDGISDESPMEPGAFAVAVRGKGQEGFLVGIAAARCGGGSSENQDVGLEIVVFGRPDRKWEELMYLPEDVLKMLFPEGTSVDVRVLASLAPVQHDCPPQWLRDRFLRLAEEVEKAYAGAFPKTSPDELEEAVEFAGIFPVALRQATDIVPPADTGKRVGEEELGYWNEEMQVGNRCGGIEGGARLDGPGILPSFPGIDSMC